MPKPLQPFRPMNLLHRRAAILAMLSACTVTTHALAQVPSYAMDIEALESMAEMLIAQGVGEARARYAPGLRSLAPDRALGAIAHERSEMMAHGAPFAHEDEQGRFVAGDRVQQRFGPYGAVGENIMMIRDPSRAFEPDAFARRAVQGWMDSPGHRATILSQAYDRSGVGVAINGSFVYATQVFWGPTKGAARSRDNR